MFIYILILILIIILAILYLKIERVLFTGAIIGGYAAGMNLSESAEFTLKNIHENEDIADRNFIGGSKFTKCKFSGDNDITGQSEFTECTFDHNCNLKCVGNTTLTKCTNNGTGIVDVVGAFKIDECNLNEVKATGATHIIGGEISIFTFCGQLHATNCKFGKIHMLGESDNCKAIDPKCELTDCTYDELIIDSAYDRNEVLVEN